MPAIRCILLLPLLVLAGCAANPLAGPVFPVDAAWDPVVPAARYGTGDFYPCTYVFPYFHGYDADGSPRCTVRPLDMQYEDVDVLVIQ